MRYVRASFGEDDADSKDAGPIPMKIVDLGFGTTPAGHRFRYESTIAEMAEAAVQSKDLFEALGVRMAPTCELARMIGELLDMERSSREGVGSAPVDAFKLMRASIIHRICAAIVDAKDDPLLPGKLRKITSGSFDPRWPSRTEGRDIVWELQLRHMLSLRQMKVRLDEPDLVVTGESEEFGIACKKIYGEASLDRALRNATKQIKGAHRRGLIAINIDALMPPRLFLIANTPRELNGKLVKRVDEFTRDNLTVIRRYADRVAGLLISLDHFALGDSGMIPGNGTICQFNPSARCSALDELEKAMKTGGTPVHGAGSQD